jgi:hypothetical protein
MECEAFTSRAKCIVIRVSFFKSHSKQIYYARNSSGKVAHCTSESGHTSVINTNKQFAKNKVRDQTEQKRNLHWFSPVFYTKGDGVFTSFSCQVFLRMRTCKNINRNPWFNLILLRVLFLSSNNNIVRARLRWRHYHPGRLGGVVRQPIDAQGWHQHCTRDSWSPRQRWYFSSVNKEKNRNNANSLHYYSPTKYI